MFKALLCIPPDYDYHFPPLATPALCGFLKQNGFFASQIDLNLGYRDFLLDKIDGSKADRNLKKTLLRDIVKKFFDQRLKNRYYSSFLPRRDNGFSRELPYDNNSNSSFYFTERLLASEHLFRYLEDEKENSFLQFYLGSGIISSLREQHIGLVGISIISPTQAIASLTLGALIKKNLPLIHVNIGGQWPTLYRKQIIKKQELFRCFDSVIVFEGETPLLKLSRAIKNKSSFKIPNLLLKGSKKDFSFTRTQECLDSLPPPDFDGLPLKDYFGSLGGNRSLTFETSRGCYWSKCAYCVDLPLPKPSYRYKKAGLVVRDMRELQRKYKATNLMFGDPGLSPRQMLAISREILKKKIKIDWWTMARLDPGFTREIFDLAFKAGLKQVNFGFESACDRVCDFLDKGNRRERSQRVIRDCSQAGIKVDLQTMIGLPGETFQDGLETVDFLVSNKEFIDHVTFNVYYLTPANYIYLNPRKYGIKYKRESGLPFAFFIPFKNKSRMTGQDAELLQKIHLSLVFRKNKSSFGNNKNKRKARSGILSFELNGESVNLKHSLDPLTGIIKVR